MKESGLYIHIPFCRSKCIYCDFFSGGVTGADWGLLTTSLLQEISERAAELESPPTTIYIGGGTPSLMPSDKFQILSEGILNIFGKDCGHLEFTIEVNPEDVNTHMCEIWKQNGVSRISMGVQSFVDSELKAIKRRHDSAKAIVAYKILREYFGNISIDLMFGLPGQTVESWLESVERTIELKPKHISAYSLMFEEGTPINVLREKKLIRTPLENECLKMWELLSSKLSKAGYIQYEISNYAIPGNESIHNMRYWSGNPYLGIGPSAHSYDGCRVRKANRLDIKGYLKRFGQNITKKETFYNEEILSEEELLEEAIMTGMRTRDGVNIEKMTNRFGEKRIDRVIHNARSYIERGLLKYENSCMILDKSGIMISDDIILALIM